MFSKWVYAEELDLGEIPTIVVFTSDLVLDGLADCRMESRQEGDYQIQCFSCEKWLSTKQVQVPLEYVPINAYVCG